MGYSTAIVGKWHLGVGENLTYLPTNYGFDYYMVSWEGEGGQGEGVGEEKRGGVKTSPIYILTYCSRLMDIKFGCSILYRVSGDNLK